MSRTDELSAADLPNKELRPLVRVALDAGWKLTRGGKHYKLTSPAGACVFMSGTGVGSRGVQNMRSVLKRAGLDV